MMLHIKKELSIILKFKLRSIKFYYLLTHVVVKVKFTLANTISKKICL